MHTYFRCLSVEEGLCFLESILVGGCDDYVTLDTCACVCVWGGGRGVAKKVVCSDEILCMGFDVADSLYKMLC